MSRISDERDERGLYGKFHVCRTDGRDQPFGDKAKAEYFVLDYVYDPYSIPALLAYADACREVHPLLAVDLTEIVRHHA